MSELMPDSDTLASTYKEVVARAPSGGGHAAHEDSLAVFKSRLRHRSDGLTAFVMVNAEEDWSPEQLRELAEIAMVLGGEIVRGLNDCLKTGTLQGYVGVTEDRVAALVENEGGPADDPGGEVVFSGIQAEIDGWLGVVGRHAAVARHGATGAEVTVREAFAALGAAASMAAFLRQRAKQFEAEAR